MTALEEAVLLLLGYEMGQYERLMYKTKAPPNPFKEAREKLQAEIRETERKTGEGDD